MAFLIKNQPVSQRLNLPMLRVWHHETFDTATLPATAAATIFNVNDGNVMIHLLYGEIVAVGTTGANNLKINNKVDTGTVLIVASNLDVDGFDSGSLLLVEGDGTAIIGGDGTQPVFIAGTPVPWICKPGVIEHETSATKTATIQWDIYWEPLDAEGTVTKA